MASPLDKPFVSILPLQLSSTDQMMMADKELDVHGSPGSAGSTNSCVRGLAQDTQQVFRIPHRAVLDMLLAHLGLSPAQYEHVVHEDDKIHVTVFFNTSTLGPGGPISMKVSCRHSYWSILCLRHAKLWIVCKLPCAIVSPMPMIFASKPIVQRAFYVRTLLGGFLLCAYK